MSRSVNHAASKARRKRILKQTRGYYGARRNVWTVAKNTWEKGLTYAYRDRRKRKSQFRRLWITRINAAARMNGITYNRLIQGLRLAEIEVDRKILAELAVNDFAAFSAICEAAKNALPEDVNAPKNAA